MTPRLTACLCATVIALAGCGEDSDQSESSAPDPAPTTQARTGSAGPGTALTEDQLDKSIAREKQRRAEQFGEGDRKQLELRLPGGTGERTIEKITSRRVTLKDTAPADETAARSILRSYVRSGYTQALRVEFSDRTYHLTARQIAGFEQADRSGTLNLEEYAR